MLPVFRVEFRVPLALYFPLHWTCVALVWSTLLMASFNKQVAPAFSKARLASPGCLPEA